jgi:hypothetical protein
MRQHEVAAGADAVAELRHDPEWVVGVSDERQHGHLHHSTTGEERPPGRRPPQTRPTDDELLCLSWLARGNAGQ